MSEMQAFYNQVIDQPGDETGSYQAALRAIARMAVNAIRKLELSDPWATWTAASD